MRANMIVLWALVGWCGNVPLIISFPRLRHPDPEPPPRPEWLTPRIIGVVAGVIGGWLFVQAFGPQPEPWLAQGPHPEPWAMAVFAAASAVGAFILSRFVTDIYASIKGRM